MLTITKLPRPISDETRRKMRESHLGPKNFMFGKHRKMSAETCQRMSESRRGSKNPIFGKPRSLETKLKIRKALLGRVIPAEVIQKTALQNRGQHRSEESRRRMSVAQTGSKHPMSEAAKKHLGELRQGRKVSHEGRQNISLSKLGSKNPMFGKHHNAETRRRLRLLSIRRHNVVGPRLGYHEQQLLNEREQLEGIKILRQYPITDLGFFVDGYCKDTNTVYEVYEVKHRRYVEKDRVRENEIRKCLNCEFVVIWDINKN